MAKIKGGIYLLCLPFLALLLHCSLTSFPPQIKVQVTIEKQTRVLGARGPALSGMAVYVLAITNQPDSIKSADVAGRSLACLNLSGLVLLTTYADLTGGGVSAALAPGRHQFTVLGFENSGVVHPTSVAQFFSSSPNLKGYILAQNTVDVSSVNTVTLNATYSSSLTPDQIYLCPTKLRALVVENMVGLKYLSKAGAGNWTVTSAVDGAGISAGNLAVDSEGTAHITFMAAAGVWYANNSSGSFPYEQVVPDIFTNSVNNSSVAVTADGIVHILANHQVGSINSVAEIYGRSGNWTVGSVAALGLETSSYYPILSHVGRANKQIAASSPSISGTQLEVNVTPWSTPTQITLAGSATCQYTTVSVADLDPQGFGHVAYICTSISTNELGYANNLTGSWLTQSLYSTLVENLQRPSLFIDSAGNMYLLYLKASTLIFQTGTASNGTWQPAGMLSTTGTVGTFAINATSPTNVNILYFGDATLYYMTNSSGSWVTTTVGSFVPGSTVQRGFW